MQPQPPPGGPPPEPPSPQDKALAGLVSMGLTGTVAVVGAFLGRVDLWSLFRWDADDFVLALKVRE